VELVSRRDEFQLKLFLFPAAHTWQIEVGHGKIEVELVSPRDEKAISLKCFETIFSCKIVLKIILLKKKSSIVTSLSLHHTMVHKIPS
jgi:hypothetical protein